MRGRAGTAARTIGLFGGILSYAVELGIIEQNPVHGVRKPKDRINARRLSEEEYRTLGDILKKAVDDGQYKITAEMIRVIALTGCRRSEVIGLRHGEVDIEGSCLRLTDSKEGASVRPIGLPVLEYLEGRRAEEQVLKTMSFPAGRRIRHSEASPGTGQSYSKRPTWPASHRMFCDTGSPALPMTLGSPRQRSPPWLVIPERDGDEPLHSHR
jgi:integrase